MNKAWTGIVSGILVAAAVIYVLGSMELVPANQNEVICAVNLKEIHQALKDYAKENGNRYPDDLLILVNNGSTHFKQLLCYTQRDLYKNFDQSNFTRDDYTRLMAMSDYVYLGKGHHTQEGDPDKIIIYERPHIHSNNKVVGMNIITGSGQVTFYSKEKGLQLLKSKGINVKGDDDE